MCREILWPHSVPIFSFSLKYIPLLLCELIIWCWTTTDDFLLIRISDACYDASELSLFSANRTHQVNSKMFFKSRERKWSPDLNKMLPWGKAPKFSMPGFQKSLSKLWHFSNLEFWTSAELKTCDGKNLVSVVIGRTYWLYGLHKFVAFPNWLFYLIRRDLQVLKNKYNFAINYGAAEAPQILFLSDKY